MDDSERSYGYSEDIYHGRRGAGGHYGRSLRGGGDGPSYPDQEPWERSYEYGPEWSTGRPHPADFGPEEAAVRTRGGRGDGRRPSPVESGAGFGRGGSDGGGESWTWDVEGPHRGRGPEGYRRSDERIHEEICERLSANGRLDASHLRVRVDDGEVTLEGRVPDRRSKRLAEAVSDTVRGVVDVHNRLLLEDGGQGDGRREQPPRGAEHRPAERLAAEGRDPESGRLLEEGEPVGAGAERRS
ncbi:MAG TPA: BON domain-containing protein [Thermoanaerobaculia bacterium]|nr:BON domain-containing protein [Thermoanaerobaculia bacterium]